MKRLVPGSVIGVVGTGSPLADDRFQAGVSVLKQKGYQVRYSLSPSRDYGDYCNGFANGSASERIAALMSLVRDPEVSVIISARGGYGSMDLLDKIDFAEISQSQTAIVGLSDFTALLLPLAFQHGGWAIHGSSLGSAFADYNNSESAQRSANCLLNLLHDPKYRPAQQCVELRAGVGKGPVLAGNLSMLTALLGTRWDVSYDGVVLVVEEVGDAPYKVHRALTQLKLAGKLDNLAALVFGRFSRCEAAHGPTVADVLSMVVGGMVADTKYPIISGLEMGHWGENLPLPLGCLALVENGTLRLLESPLE